MGRYRGNIMGLDDQFEFGSNIGTTIREVIKWRPASIQWYLKNIPNFKISDEAAIMYMKGIDRDAFNDKRVGYWRDLQCDFGYYLPYEQMKLHKRSYYSY